MAKKRKAKKAKIKRKGTAKKNNPKKASTRKPHRVVAKSEKQEPQIPQTPTPHDVFEGIKGRPPTSEKELNEWLASPEGKAAMIFESTSLSRWGEAGRS